MRKAVFCEICGAVPTLNVPDEPTERMVAAGIAAAIQERDHLADEGVREIYRAMIAAAKEQDNE